VIKPDESLTTAACSSNAARTDRSRPHARSPIGLDIGPVIKRN
jgi:hypothetical protein